MEKLELGCELRDKLTGFQGIATSRHEYLTGCTQYGLQPTSADPTTLHKIEYFDEGRLVLIDYRINKQEVLSEENGCDVRERP